MSELARLMAQIDAEIESAQRGLSGLSQGSATHAVITAKTEQTITVVAPLMDRVNVLLGNTKQEEEEHSH